MVKADERVGTGGTYPIQGPQSNCSAATTCSISGQSLVQLVQCCYSVTRLTVATQQTFLQVSQSGYTNVIDGHASLQSWRVKNILSSELPSDLVFFDENNSMNEVYKWLKNLPGDLKLEKCSKDLKAVDFIL